ncbi:Uracil-DNA glycosylase [Fasciola gigantica]|uniref:Uracil-DNA glycosylase n=1 Tax=Fasciola gigantica TaxID=46835 RepID=A0A504YYU6_FASGI|nr:Uracil-DNA glycosylase [Fasciola gigantica]
MFDRLSPEGQCSAVSSEGALYNGKRKRLRSPLAASRLEEKKELQDLNDRLSRYIEHIQKNLFSAGSPVDVDEITRSVKHQLEDLSGLYSDELDAARKNLDSIALQLANCQVKLKTAQNDRDELKKELELMKTRDKHSADEISALTAELSRLESEMKRGRDLQRDYDDLVKQHAIVKEQLERETVMRTDWQNRVLTLTEKLEFKDRLLEKERATWGNEAIQIQMRTVAKEAEKYRSKLKEKLDELREEMADQLDELQSKMENTMLAQLEVEKGKTKDAEARAKAAREECNRITSLLSARSSELVTCRREIETLRRTIDQLNAQLEDMEDRLNTETKKNREEINRLLNLVDEKTRECAELASIKVQLDAEIAMYRSLLEAEESRCRLSPSEKEMTGAPIVKLKRMNGAVKRTSSTSNREVDLDANLADTVSTMDYVTPTKLARLCKRPHVRDKHSTSFDEVYTHGSRKALRITCYATGSVHFASADPGDGLLRISNASDEVVDLNQWQLHFGPTRPGAEDFVTLHQFGESQKLNPHAEMRVHVCPTRGSQFHCIPSKKPKRQLTSLYLITDAPVWDPYKSVITLHDAQGAVRAFCEIEEFNDHQNNWLQNRAKETCAVRTIRVTCTATGDVHFKSAESGKGILSLGNASNESIDLSGWDLDFECANDHTSQKIPEGFRLEPHGEIHIDLRPFGEKIKPISDDLNSLSIFTKASPQDYHDSDFTLYGPDRVVRAVAKIECISPEEHHRNTLVEIGAEDEAEEINETSDESEVDEREETRFEDASDSENRRQPRRGDASGGAPFDAAFYTRYQQFLDAHPTRRINPCSCPLM